MSVIAEPSRPRSRVAFHQLTVASVLPACDDGSAVVVSLRVPPELRPTFDFAPGQHVTVRATIADEEVRRSYSLCSTPSDLSGEGVLRIGVRAVPDGVFSTYACTSLAAGDTLDVLAPLGSFTTTVRAERRRHYGAVVAGSGITPVLSLVASVLAVEPRSTFTVVYGNRFARSAMFVDELADLKDRYGARFQLVYAFSGEDQREGLDRGRLDAETLAKVGSRVFPMDMIDEWFLCGPVGLVTGTQDLLAALGVDPESVHSELFYVGEAPPPRVSTEAASGVLTVLLEGRASTVPVAKGQNLLQAARAARPEVPFSCSTGVCGTCRAKVLHGRTEMTGNWALSTAEVAAGQVLTCRSTAATDDVTLDFDL
jgi:ring-1,2-phenylacetyl-CoA epoxidase subunit PaaE